MPAARSTGFRSAFAIGGPVFNIGLVAILMSISFAAVALPERTGEPAVDESPTNLAFANETTTSAPAPPIELGTPLVAPALDDDDIRAVAEIVGEMIVEANEVFEPPSSTLPSQPPEVVQVVYRTEPSPPTTTVPPPRPECTDYDTRPEAQAAFDADPDELAHFDGDGDGRACEHIPDPTDTSQIRCDQFVDQPEAQAVYDSDREALAHLDGDGDGRACEQLPGAPPEGPPVAEPPQVLSVSAVREQRGVFGLHTREAPWWMGEFDYVTRLIGKAPNNLLFFSNWSKPFPAEQVSTAWNRGMTPQIAWEPIIPGADQQPQLAEMIRGEWDPYIDAWAQAAAAHDQPIVLRLASEMNGNWYPWSEQVNGNSEGEFIEMWQHVHNRFEAAGADNVIWLWSVNRLDNLHTDIGDYWPGAEYVDWVGISGYWRGYEVAPEPTFAAVFDETLEELRNITDKPILLAEIGAGTNVDSDRVAWLNTVFAGLEASPDIIGFVYFNELKSGGDWRVQFSQNMVDALAAGVASERFASGVLPPGMEPGERLPVPAD